MSACPTQHELEGLFAGRLDTGPREKLERHIADCAICRGCLDTIRDEAALGDALRGSGLDTTQTVVKPPATALFAHFTPKGGSAPIDSSEGADGGAAAAKPPDIPGYEFLSVLHRGGQGVVYKAVQKATRRTVAVKLLLFGAASSPRQQRRFEREIDLISTLQHPNIVSLYDSGTVDELPYMVMEYVRGQALHEYLATVKPPLEQRLQLFSKICGAVAHAHFRGVIHRDLKPANILVDTLGEPRVLDFGLAKAMGRDLVTGGRPVSLTNEFFGTLAYASPEQARGQNELIDIRTDVYSLGVILYELITGEFPYQVVGDIATVLRNIVDVPPQPPSTWLKRSGGKGAPRAPSSTSIPLLRHISDDLETVVLKSLSKDRERRYASAEALRQDVEHFLKGDPIDAKRDSAWYVLYMLSKRHWYSTAMLAAVLVAMISFGAISFHFYRQKSDALEAKGRSDVTAKDASTLANIGAAGLHGRPRAMALGWFLAEWNEGRLERAGEIAQGFPGGSAQRKCVDFLLADRYGTASVDTFVAGFPQQDRGLAWFAAGELARRHGDTARAVESFEKCLECLKAATDPDLVPAAKARLEQMRSVPRASSP